MKISLPTAVSTGSFRKRHPLGRRIRAISAKISALCRVVLPGIIPDKIMSKLDSLWAAEKKEDSNQQSPGPQNLPIPPKSPQRLHAWPSRINSYLFSKCYYTTVTSKRGKDTAALLSLSLTNFISFCMLRGKSKKGRWTKTKLF